MPHSPWNGEWKYSHPECPSCPYQLAGGDAQRILARVRFPRNSSFPPPVRFCAWGVAIKYLTTPIARACEFRHKPAPGWSAWQCLLTSPLSAIR